MDAWPNTPAFLRRSYLWCYTLSAVYVFADLASSYYYYYYQFYRLGTGGFHKKAKPVRYVMHVMPIMPCKPCSQRCRLNRQMICKLTPCTISLISGLIINRTMVANSSDRDQNCDNVNALRGESRRVVS